MVLVRVALLLSLLGLCQLANASIKSSVLIIIRGQSNIFNHKVAHDLRLNLEEQISKHNIKSEVILLHREWPVEAAWSITPIIPDISVRFGDKYQWVMFVDDQTVINVDKLVSKVLPRYNYDDHVALGHCLYDTQPTIIHHFFGFDGNPKDFKYPDLDGGLIVSTALLSFIRDQWKVDGKRASFQIDVKHEFAKMLMDQYDVKMTCVEELCGVKSSKSCATWLPAKITSDCGDMMSLDEVHFSVKTTQKFHEERLKRVVLKTWGPIVSNHVTYYSNFSDPSIPTIDCGVENTESGHCGKTEKIIRDFADGMKDKKWLVIADDDTIMSVARMLKLLSCYNHQQPIVLGERYGFGLNTGYGYSYITGGGGMVLSRRGADDFVKKGCKCPIISAPDDMYLGQCFTNSIGVPVIHSPLFHQARPDDYSEDFLANQLPISFHKHWMTDPVKIYRDWFAADDDAAFSAAPPTPAAPTQEELYDSGIPPTPLKSNIKDEL